MKRITIILFAVIVLIGCLFFIFREDNAVMLSVPEYNQHPDYPTGCESASLYILLRYYDVDVSMEQIVEELPKGPLPYQNDGILVGANPENEFVGNPKDSNSYGVFNEPIKTVANKFKEGAKTKNNATLEDIETLISKGHPVIAWYTTNPNVGIIYKNEWIDYKTGEQIKWPSYEHAVVIVGCSKDNIFYNDPNTGSGAGMSKKYFIQAFNQLGGRIVYYDN
jgi:uncharacterized protein YvpB